MNDNGNENIEEYLQSEIEYTKAKLAERMTTLGNFLIKQAKEISERENPIVNSCGEIQGAGTTIDILCGQLGVLNNALGRCKIVPEKK